MSKHLSPEVRVPIERDNVSIFRDEDKCIKCGQCRDMCRDYIGVLGHYSLKATGDRAVFYTHLDVYKRQVRYVYIILNKKYIKEFYRMNVSHIQTCFSLLNIWRALKRRHRTDERNGRIIMRAGIGVYIPHIF